MNKHNERAELIRELKELAEALPFEGGKAMDYAAELVTKAAALLEAQRPALKPLTEEQIDAAGEAFDEYFNANPFDELTSGKAVARVMLESAHGITGEAQPAREWVEVVRSVLEECDVPKAYQHAIIDKLREKNAGQPAADTGIDAGENPPNKTLYVIMARHGLNMVVGEDMKRLLDYGRDVWRKATADKACGDEPVAYIDKENLPLSTGQSCLAYAGPGPANFNRAAVYTHPQPQAEVRVPDGWREELELIEAVLKGYPVSMALLDALRATRKLLAAAPKPQEASQ